MGFVEDLSQYYSRCRLSVAPLRYGAGLKGKVAESMGFGVPCVASSLAVEGMDIASHKKFFVADEPMDFAETVCRLLQNEEDWNKIAEFGIEFVRNNYSLESCRKKLTCLMNDLEVFQDAAEPLELSKICSDMPFRR